MQFPDEKCIDFLERTVYIKNPSVEELSNQENLCLENFICYCVGKIADERVVHSIRICAKTPLQNISSYLIEWWHLSDFSLPPITFWVNSVPALRKHFFSYEDQKSFRQSTFIYDEGSMKYFRVGEILSSFKICEILPLGAQIFTKPMKSYLFKQSSTWNQEKQRQRDIKEFKKTIQKVKDKYKSMPFVFREYPLVFQEFDKITNLDSNGNTES